MRPFHSRSTSEQLAAHLRREILRGEWVDTMPGVKQIVQALGVNSRAVTEALKRLEKEGILEGQGPRRCHRIVGSDRFSPPALRLMLLLYDRGDVESGYLVRLRHELQMAGHQIGLARQTLEDLRLDPLRVARLVSRTDADAWVVLSGSLEVLRWFSEKKLNTFSIFGRPRSLPVAAAFPDKRPAIRQAVDRLVELGHRRFVLLTREERRKPGPGQTERAFLDALDRHGLQAGSFNLPDWGNDMAAFHGFLESLFRYTPPTALFFGGSYLFIAAERHLAQRGIVAPRDVSLVSTDYYPDAFFWCHPPVSHIRWDSRSLVRRIVRWAGNVARGKDDRRQTMTKAEFIEGGTIGPAPHGR